MEKLIKCQTSDHYGLHVYVPIIHTSDSYPGEVMELRGGAFGGDEGGASRMGSVPLEEAGRGPLTAGAEAAGPLRTCRRRSPATASVGAPVPDFSASGAARSD